VRYTSLVTGSKKRKTTFVSVNLTPAARDKLRQAAVQMTSAAGYHLSMSDVAIAACDTAMRHGDDLLAALSDGREAER
jgi:hypothetical protein